MKRQAKSLFSSGTLVLAAACSFALVAQAQNAGRQLSTVKPDTTAETARLKKSQAAQIVQELLTRQRVGAQLSAATRSKIASQFLADTANGSGGIGAVLVPASSASSNLQTQPAHAAGVRFQKIYLDYPAAQVGLHAGDIILAVDGRGTANVAPEVVGQWLRGTVGTDVTLTVETSLKEVAPNGLTGYRRFEVILTRAPIAKLRATATPAATALVKGVSSSTYQSLLRQLEVYRARTELSKNAKIYSNRSPQAPR